MALKIKSHWLSVGDTALQSKMLEIGLVQKFRDAKSLGQATIVTGEDSCSRPCLGSIRPMARSFSKYSPTRLVSIHSLNISVNTEVRRSARTPWRELCNPHVGWMLGFEAVGVEVNFFAEILKIRATT